MIWILCSILLINSAFHTVLHYIIFNKFRAFREMEKKIRELDMYRKLLYKAVNNYIDATNLSLGILNRDIKIHDKQILELQQNKEEKNEE